MALIRELFETEYKGTKVYKFRIRSPRGRFKGDLRYLVDASHQLKFAKEITIEEREMVMSDMGKVGNVVFFTYEDAKKHLEECGYINKLAEKGKGK